MSRDKQNGVKHTVRNPSIFEQLVNDLIGHPTKKEHTVTGHGRTGKGSSRREAENNWRKGKK